VEGIKYNISVIQISKILSFEVATAPTLGPATVDLTSAMSAYSCKVFSFDNNFSDLRRPRARARGRAEERENTIK
jgi:hypothetical protein